MKSQAVTLSAALELFLQEFRPSTRKSYGMVLEKMRDFVGPARPLGQIQPQHLVEYIQSVRDRPSVKSPATVNKHIKTIKTFAAFCVRLGYITENPADVLKYARTGKFIRRGKAMTDDEFEQLLDFAKWKPRDHALILFLADTGCRAGGAAGLAVADLDLEAMTAKVTEKGDKTRTVWFGPVCKQALERWLQKRPKGAGPYVFTRDGHQMQSAVIGQIVRRDCLAAGLRSLGSHSLRHRKGHQLADNRIAPSVAATALGHSSPTITLEYYYPKDDERAEKAMRELAEGYEAPVIDEGGAQPAAPERGKIIDLSQRLVNR